MTDPFIHLPHLRDRLTPADHSELRVTVDVLAQWDERARRLGRPADWRLTDAQREASRRALLGDWAVPRGLWFFAYGSLMWDPGIHFSEVRLARLEGFQRRFTYKTSVGRGSPQTPALLLAIESLAGNCTGLAFRVSAEQAEQESAIMWRREMVRGNYAPALLPLSTPQGPIEAVVLCANTQHPEYVGELPLDQTVAMIATAAGPLGSNRSYLEQLAAQLLLLGIEDAYVEELMARVRRQGSGD